MKKVVLMGAAALLLALPITAMTAASTDSADTVIPSLKGLHDITKTNVIKSAEMLDEALYSYQPTDEVRTMGQLFGHIADAQGMFCGAAGSRENTLKAGAEQLKTKAEMVAALNAAFKFCDDVYASMTDADGAVMVEFFGNQMAASAVLAFNSAHNYEHYGNLVTYMRINGITPPSSM